MEPAVWAAIVVATASLVVSIVTYLKDQRLRGRQESFERAQNDLNRLHGDTIAKSDRDSRAAIEVARIGHERELADLQHAYARMETFVRDWIPKRLDVYVDFVKALQAFADTSSRYGRCESELNSVISARDDGVISSEQYEQRHAEIAVKSRPLADTLLQMERDVTHFQTLLRLLADDDVVAAADLWVEGAKRLQAHPHAWVSEYNRPRAVFVERARDSLSFTDRAPDV